MASSVLDSMYFYLFFPCVSNFNNMIIVKLYMELMNTFIIFHNNFMKDQEIVFI